MTRSPSRSVEYQRHYFDGHERTPRIALGRTPAVCRHVAETIDPLGLPNGASVLEIGCGLGRFTDVLLDRGYAVTALDLSAYLTDRLRATLGRSERLTVVTGRAEDVPDLAPGPYDAVVGFFFLHHLPQLEAVFEAASRVLAPGGRLAFCEPNAFNPLVYLQVTFTPRMRWKGEPSIPKMRPAVVFPMLDRIGYREIETHRYGMLPPAVANTRLGGRAERAIEALPPIRPLSAYRVFRARWRPV
jgi:SAM-dependent methyltransferase